MPRAAVLTVVMAALLCALVAQPSAQATRAVQGRVVADDTGDPISNAKVGFSTIAAARATLTDRDGRFALDVPAGIARLAFKSSMTSRFTVRRKKSSCHSSWA